MHVRVSLCEQLVLHIIRYSYAFIVGSHALSYLHVAMGLGCIALSGSSSGVFLVLLSIYGWCVTFLLPPDQGG